MTIKPIPCSSPQGRSLSCNVTTVFAVLAAMTFSASGAAPTPLYQEYQSHFGLTPFMVTVIFATYVLCLLLALLTVGSLSDFLGRRPAIIGALGMNVAAMIIFMTADSPGALIVARAVQGFATGLAATTLGATILDTDRDRAPMLNSVTAFAGLSAGTLLAGVLVTFAPAPEQLVFVVLLVPSVIEAAVLWFMPETSALKPGALASLIPRVRIPFQARAAFMSITPVHIAAWALGGFYLSLMPAVVRVATGATLPIVGGVVVATLTLTGAVIVVALRNVAPERMLRMGVASLSLGVVITLAGVQWGLVGVMMVGTVVSGMGFGSAFSGTLGTVMPLARPDGRESTVLGFIVAPIGL
jgi:MFS family permease